MRRRAVTLLAPWIACLVACGPAETTEPDPDPQNLCEVPWVAEAGEYAARGQAGELWEPGPHFVWTSSPADACADHPTFEGEGGAEVALHVHFPASGDPLAGDGAGAAAGPWPVVVFIHSNLDRKKEDGSCVPIFERYRSLHAHWASWGYVVASVDNTAQNCRRDADNLYERSELQLGAVAALEAMNADPEDRLFGRVDTGKLVFAGHSRGGGSSLLSYNAADYPVAGVIGLQPLSMSGFGAPRVDAPYIGFTAGEDVDLNYPHVEVTEEVLDGAYTMVTINGGIHAWTGDTIPQEPDDEPLITHAEQHDVTQLYTTAFLASVIGLSDGSASPEFTPRDMSDVLYGHGGARAAGGVSALGAAARWRAPGEDATLIDDFDRADPSTNALGGAHEVVSMQAAEELYTFKPDEDSPSAGHRKATSLRLTPPAGGPGVWRTSFGAITGLEGATLQARIKGADGGPAPSAIVVTLRGAGGAEQRVEVGAEHIGPRPLTNRYTQLVVPIEGEQLDQVELELEGGALFIDALRVVE